MKTNNNTNNKNTVMNPSLPREYRSTMNKKPNGEKRMRNVSSNPRGTLRKSFCAFLSVVFLISSTAAQAGKITTYIHTDHLGNPVAKTDSQGDVIERQSYSPDGEAYQHADADGPGYTGHRHDAATNLVYMQARYYDPVAGRFLSIDPVEYDMGGEPHFNRYWYANGNPYSYIDPTGMCSEQHSDSEFACHMEDTIAKLLEPFIEKAMHEAGIEVASEDERDPDGVYDYEAEENSVAEEAAAIIIGGVEARLGNRNRGGSKPKRKSDSSKNEKLSKVKKSTEVRPGNGPGQSRAEYIRYKNKDGKVIRTKKDSYDRAGKLQHSKPMRGGPEGRPQDK